METWQGTEALILSGSPEQEVGYVASFLQAHPSVKVVCADSGTRHLAKLHCHPDLIVGDFDSSVCPDIDCERIQLVPENDDTDTMHALKGVFDRGCTSFWIAFATGGWLDHLLSNFSLFEYAWDRGSSCRILDSQNELFFVDSDTIELARDDAYKYFSIIPLDYTLHGVSITGAKYPLSDASVTRSTMYTISNEVTASHARIAIKQGRAFIIRSRDRAR